MSENIPDHQTPGHAGSLYTLLVFVSILLVFIVVILSAWLRLSGSGQRTRSA